MWFKSAAVYKVISPSSINLDEWQEAMRARTLEPCQKVQPFSLGWVSPFEESEELALSVGPYALICLGKEEKILPASVVRDAVADRVEEIENQSARKVYGREKATLRDDITFQLLPQAFTRNKRTWAYLDIKQQLLIVDASSESKLEEFLAFMAETLEDFSVVIAKAKVDLTKQMTEWMLEREAPTGLALANSCVMQDQDKTESSVRFSSQELTAQEVIDVLRTHRRVMSLGLVWQDRIEFVLNDNGMLTRIKFLDIIKTQNEDVETETAAQALDANFALMSYELTHCLQELFTVCQMGFEHG